MSDRLARDAPKFPRIQALIGWSALVLVLGAALLRGANWPVTWTLLAILIVVLFVLQILSDLVSPVTRAAARLWPASVLFIAVLIWGIVQTIPNILPGFNHPAWDLVQSDAASISADPRAGVHIVMRLACYAMVFWIIMRAAEVTRTAFLFTGVIALFSTALASYGIYAALTGENVLLQTTGVAVVHGSFANQNSYATYAIFSVLANMAVYLQLTGGTASNAEAAGNGTREFLERFFGGGWIFAMGVLLCLAALFLTDSRAGVASGVLAVVTFLALYAQGKKKRTLLYLLIPLVMVLFVIIALSANVISRMTLIDGDNLRFLVYPRVIEGIMDRFWVGHGLEAFEDTFRAYVPLEAAVADWNEGHSTFLENFYEMGVPAATLFYAALLFVSLGIVIGGLRRRRNKVLPYMAFACIIGAAAHSTVDFSLEIPGVTLLFAAIVGIGWAQCFSSGYVEPR